MRLRSVVRELVPPALVTWARRLHPEWRYIGTTPSLLDADGWQHPSVVQTQLRKWARWQEIVSSTGPLGVAHEAPNLRTDSIPAHNILLTFAFVVTRASRNRSTLSVLDWGGGLGHYHSVARALLPDLELHYTVMELPTTVQAGKSLPSDAHFVDSTNELVADGFDLVVASGSIQFVPDWQSLLGSLARAAREYLYIARLPVVSHAPSYIAAQRAHRYGYETEYRGWCLNRDEVLRTVHAAGAQLVREFALEEHPFIAGAPEQPTSAGYLFRKAR